MRKEGLRGCIRGRRTCSTRRDKRTVPAEELLRRDFAAAGQIGSRRQTLLTSVLMKASHLRTELVVDALQMAFWRRKAAPGLIHHSDQGVQYTSLSFGKRLEQVDFVSSTGRVGSALDNAISESLVATLKSQLVSRTRFPSRQAAKTAIFEYLEAFYNTRRLRSSLGYRSLADFEEDRMREASVA